MDNKEQIIEKVQNLIDKKLKYSYKLETEVIRYEDTVYLAEQIVNLLPIHNVSCCNRLTVTKEDLEDVKTINTGGNSPTI